MHLLLVVHTAQCIADPLVGITILCTVWYLYSLAEMQVVLQLHCLLLDCIIPLKHLTKLCLILLSSSWMLLWKGLPVAVCF